MNVTRQTGESIGFIGLGNMGLPMAANLVRAGHRVTGFDVVTAAKAAAARAGVAVVGTVADAARDVEMVVTMLPDGQLVLEVYESALAVASPGTLFIDSSTIDVARARLAHEAAAKAGQVALDPAGLAVRRRGRSPLWWAPRRRFLPRRGRCWPRLLRDISRRDERHFMSAVG